MNDAGLRVALRVLAIGVAIAALVDPSITSRRTTKPDVAVLVADSAHDMALANDVARSIGKSYSVMRGPLSGAAATVVVGRSLPATPLALGAPVFAVAADGRAAIEITTLDAPRSAPALARVRVAATVHVIGARGKTVDVTLRSGSIAVDHVSRAVARDDDTLDVPLTFVPAQAALTSLRVVAHVDGAPDAVGDASVDVRDQKWAVLFYDPRPSWTSTFVRRAIERDPRFVATSRVVTSRDVNTDAGNPPGRLDDLAALSLFDAVVVGAPSALSGNDVAGLDAFLRRRGGSVIFLLDDIAAGPYQRLMNVEGLSTAMANQPAVIPVAGFDSLRLQAMSIAWPSTVPPGARSIAGREHPVVWSEPVGAGTLIVSGALDAWRYRDPASSSFDRFWQLTVADAADATPAPIAVTTSRAILAPGERFDVEATLRDEAIDAGARPVGPLQVQATLASSADSTRTIRLLPQGPGRLATRVRAPDTPGVYQVAVSVGGRRAVAPFVVARDARSIEPGSASNLRDWVRATGGEIVPSSRLAQLPALLSKTIRTAPHVVTWHPMRSAWWIVPFVLALSGEWWLRRRRGLP